MQNYKLYNDTITLEFDPDKHIYTVDDKRVEGVTGVTSVISKPALMYWAVNMAIDFLSKVLKAGRSYDELQIRAMLESDKYAHRQNKTNAGDIGTLVHEAIETYIKTGVAKNPINNIARMSFKKFLKRCRLYQLRIWACELRI